jgi:Zn-dependent protease
MTQIVEFIISRIFNLLPFPPLDGSKIFAELFGGKVAELIYKIER